MPIVFVTSSLAFNRGPTWVKWVWCFLLPWFDFVDRQGHIDIHKFSSRVFTCMICCSSLHNFLLLISPGWLNILTSYNCCLAQSISTESCFYQISLWTIFNEYFHYRHGLWFQGWLMKKLLLFNKIRNYVRNWYV